MARDVPMFVLTLRYSLVGLLFCVVVVVNGWQQIDNAAIDDTVMKNINYRLPNNTKPESYDITLITNIDQNDFNFTGRVVITLRVLEASNNITIHARQLEIKTITLTTVASGMIINLHPHTYDNITEFLVIPTQTELKKDTQYILTVEYAGILRTGSSGFYRGSYTNSKGETRWLAATQFQPLDARHAFPCYDEPSFKAIFTIHIEHGESYHAISNMREIRNVTMYGMNEGRVTTDFDPTPIMSTYLVAFIVSDYEYREFNDTNEYTPIRRVFASKDEADNTKYALIEGMQMLHELEQYLKIPFSLPALDQAVIPEFRVGAMENWGLVTYPKEYLLFDPNVDTIQRQLNITQAIAHEFSHQWFGNLVTPKWWSQLWLSEGFTTLFNTLAPDMIHPNWNYFEHFIVEYLHPILRDDAQPDTEPMTLYVEDPDGIQKRFGDISYSKAASVIRMFMFAIGEDTFRKALNYYLTNNSYSVVDENNLFERFDIAIAEDKALPTDYTMDKLFGSWSRQKGFPVLKITRNYKDGTVTVYQQKYNAVYDKNEPIDSTMWWIPYNFASATNTDTNATAPAGWLSNSEQQKVIEPSKSNVTWTNDDWLLFNIQQTGYYRVWYDDENYNLLSKELNDGDLNKIHPMNRAQILNDLHDFVYSGRVSARNLCNTMAYLRREMLYVPWETARVIIMDLYRNLQASKKLTTFKKIVAYSVEPFYQNRTLNVVDRKDIFDELSRNVAVTLACEFGVRQCLTDTYAKFQEYINGAKISQHIRSLVITNGIRSASDDETAKLWEVFLKSSRVEERQEIATAFGNIPNDATFEFYLNKTMNDRNVSAWERITFVASCAESGVDHVSIVIRFLHKSIENKNKLIEPMFSILKSISQRILTSDMEMQFHKLLNLAKENSLISNDEANDLKSVIDKNRKWQLENLQTFESEFFSGKCAENGATTATLSSVSALLFALISLMRWHWQI